MFPKLLLAAHVQPITRTVLKVELTITPDFKWEDKFHGFFEPFWIIVEDNDGEFILHHEYFMLKKQYIQEDHTLNFTVPICEPLPPQYFIRIVLDRWLGSQTVLTVSFRHLILPVKYPPPTELLDLQPLPVIALRNPAIVALYQEFKHFNPVQTQVFTVLYNTDDNVLVAAPTGTLAKERYRDWEKKFGKGMGMKVVELTGETATDLKLLEKGQVIISTPRNGMLFPIAGNRGSTFSNQSYNKIRIVALSTSLANAKDHGEWIGVSVPLLMVFLLPPWCSPVPLEIYIQGVDVANFEARMQAMTEPTYTAVVQHAKNGNPALIFVPTRKQARLTAIDLMTY
ncbi:Activating signal cointegrator 1 complex subunit [Thalictrum thalictroides]|uniref:Activating signal cointegrator 1 complex subunit n=1 Tax=Thalictrum thalictroides TaxID=46969 RepID=A0A7J6WDA5_THATH|nr:Activating signal cointegrator 1 complex subunit [Thalictrum thalictroides]